MMEASKQRDRIRTILDALSTTLGKEANASNVSCSERMRTSKWLSKRTCAEHT